MDPRGFEIALETRIDSPQSRGATDCPLRDADTRPTLEPFQDTRNWAKTGRTPKDGRVNRIFLRRVSDSIARRGSLSWRTRGQGGKEARAITSTSFDRFHPSRRVDPIRSRR